MTGVTPVTNAARLTVVSASGSSLQHCHHHCFIHRTTGISAVFYMSLCCTITSIHRKVRRWYVFRSQGTSLRSQGTSLVRLQVARYVVGMPPGHKVCRWYTSRSQGTSLVCLQIARYVVRHTSCSSAYVFSRQASGLRFHCPTHLTLSLYPLATHPVPWRGMTFARRLSIEMGMDQMLGETPGARFLLAGTYFSASVSVSLSLCPLSHNTIG